VDPLNNFDDVMKQILVNKRAYHKKLLQICFLPQQQTENSLTERLEQKEN
jgi:hypothetical protein